MLKGHLDLVGKSHIQGWAWDDADLTRRVVLELYESDEFVLRFTADKLREDFLKRGQGDGHFGFWVTLPRDLLNRSVHRLSIRFAENGRDIGNSPQNYHSDRPDADAAFSRWLLQRVEGMAMVAGRSEDLEPLFALCANALDRVLAAKARLEENSVAAISASVSTADLPERVRAVLAGAVRDIAPFHVPIIRQPSVSVIIAAGPSLHDTLVLLRSLAAGSLDCAAEIICVDATGAAEMALAPLMARGGVRYLKLGHAGSALDAYRHGLEMARGEYLMFLSGALDVPRRTMAVLRQTLAERDGRAIASPRLVGRDGRIIEAGSRLSMASGRVQIGRYDLASSRLHQLCRASDDVAWQAFMITRPFLTEIGGFTGVEQYGDVGIADLAFRARAAGGAVLAQAAAEATLAAELPFARRRPGTRLAFAKRWAESLHDLAQQPHFALAKRALVVDERLPEPDRDAASNAVLSHCESLVRLGYHVELIGVDGADEAARIERLNARGIEAHSGIDDVGAFIASRSKQFSIVYLHRISVARRLIDICKQTQPDAQVIYSVADLHFLRVGRQAELLDDNRLRDEAKILERDEKTCLQKADLIISHSVRECEMIDAFLSGSKPVHQVLWSYRIRRSPPAFAARRGVAFLGTYRHSPNVDAVRHFALGAWPRIHAAAPEHPFDVAGAHLEAAEFGDLGPGVHLRGFVRDASAYLAERRLTIAPLRYGAGVKGKVLQSFAEGVPCVMSPMAAEGIGLPADITDMLVAPDEDSFADRVITLLREETVWTAAAGLVHDWAKACLCSSTLDAKFSSLIGPNSERREAPTRNLKDQ